MGSITEVLRLLVEVDAASGLATVAKLGETSEREVSKSEKALDRWGNRLTSAGAGAIAFGAVALTGLKSAGDAASDLNEVASKSATVFGDASGEVDEFATNAAKIGLSKRQALEAASGFGNLFDQLGFASDASADMSTSLTGLAADFASFHNADITEVIEAQTAAFRGEYDSLQRFVPTINAAAVQQRAMADTGKENADALTDAEKAAATYKLMIEGAGAATGDFERTSGSAANQQRIMSANFENLKAGIGQGVLPAMTTMLGATNKVVGGLSDLNEVSDGTLGKLATFGAVGITAAGGLSMVVGQAMKMHENLSTLISGGKSVIEMLGGMKGAALAAAGAAGVGALIFAAKQLEAANQAKVLDEMAEGFEAVDYAASESSKKAIRNIEAIGMLDEAFERAEDSGGDAAEKLIDLAEEAGVGADVIKHFRDEIDQHAAATKNASESNSDLADSTSDSADAMGDQADATGDAEDALKDYQDTLKGTFDPLARMDNALADNQEAQGNLRARQLEAIAAQDSYNEAVDKYGRNSKAASEAAVENMEAQQALTDAERNARSAVIDLDSAAANLRFEMDENGLTAEDARTRFIGMATQMGYTRGEAERLAGQFGFTTSEAQRLGQQKPRPHVSVTGADSARARLASVRDTMASIPSSKNIFVDLDFGGAGGMSVGMMLKLLSGRRAMGGPVGAGRLYEVAEQGRAELLEQDGHTYLIPGSDGRVIPAGSGAELATAGVGRGGTVHVHNYYINGSLLTERAITKDLNRLTRKGRGLN